MRYRDIKLHEAAYQYELFPPNSVFHTTSPAAAFEILQAGEVRPKFDGFVSFSEKPHLHDIQAHGAVIVFDLPKLYSQLEPVVYTEQWARDHADHASYIAGEGWAQQFEFTPEDEDDDEGYDQAYAEAELEAFLQKADEDEWISIQAGVPVRFTPSCVTGLILDAVDDETRNELAQMGYGHVAIKLV